LRNARLCHPEPPKPPQDFARLPRHALAAEDGRRISKFVDRVRVIVNNVVTGNHDFGIAVPSECRRRSRELDLPTMPAVESTSVSTGHLGIRPSRAQGLFRLPARARRGSVAAWRRA
jgi:hypothetical protein